MEALDREFLQTTQKDINALSKEKEQIIQRIDAYEQTIENKIDSKSEKKLIYYRSRITTADNRIDELIRLASSEKKYTIERAEQRLNVIIQRATEERDAAIAKAEAKYDNDYTRITKSADNDKQDAMRWIEALEAPYKTPDPERIVRDKMRLRSIDAKLDTKQMTIKNYDKTKEPDYEFQHPVILKPWKPSPEALEAEKELVKLRNLARMEDQEKTRMLGDFSP